MHPAQETAGAPDTARGVQEARQRDLPRPKRGGREGAGPAKEARGKEANLDGRKASEPVWALVSGLPSPLRERRLMFMLQAYIDDSGNIGQGKTSVLAGYVASTEAWADFSNRWAVALAEAPAIGYLKTSHAMLLKGEFSGWTDQERDQKLDRLIEVINGTDIVYGAVAVLHNKGFYNVAKGETD